MKVNPINNNYAQNKTNFKAGKIKIVNPEIWTDAELKAFTNNNAFKTLAGKLKKKNLDLFAKLENNINCITFNRTLKLSSGKDENSQQNLIQKIIGPIWCCTPERRSLVDNIATFPIKLENLFYKQVIPFEREKKVIAKDLEKYNLIIEDIDYWHFSEIKALQANDNFKTLAKRLELEDSKIRIVREFSEYNDVNYLEFYSQDNLIGMIHSSNNALGCCYYTGSLVDCIAKFETFIPKDSEIIKKEALSDIEKYNKSQR